MLMKYSLCLIFTYYASLLLVFSPHHLEELSVVDHAIVVVVHLLYQSVDFIVCHGLIFTLETLLELIGANGS